MLLELFIQFAGGARVSVKSLVIASGAPETTAGRMLNRLESHGLVERKPSATDRRVMPVSLTSQGVIRVGSALKVADC
jgi:DNA-binding MarR family transcriptional regulator